MRKAAKAVQKPLGRTVKSSQKNQPPVYRISAIHLKQEKVCKQCGQIFLPKRCTTDFCSKICYQKNYYQTHRNLPEVHGNAGITTSSFAAPLLPDAADDMVSVKEVARRLKCSKQSIYNLINAGKINLIHFTSKLSFVRWSEILSYNGAQTSTVQQSSALSTPPGASTPKSAIKRRSANAPQVQPNSTRKPIRKKNLYECRKNEPEWCDIEYAITHLNFKSSAAFHSFVFNNKIRKQRKDKRPLYLISDIQAARIGIAPDLLAQGYLSVKQASEKFGIPRSRIYKLMSLHNISTILYRGKGLFLESDLRVILTTDKTA